MTFNIPKRCTLGGTSIYWKSSLRSDGNSRDGATRRAVSPAIPSSESPVSAIRHPQVTWSAENR